MPRLNLIMEKVLRHSLQECGVKKVLIDLLFSVFPGDSFKKYIDTFRDSIEQPSKMISITELGIQLGERVTSHIMVIAREFLSLPNFPMFTRDYMKRCCDLVEYTVKFRLAPKLGIDVGRKPLGTVVKILGEPRYENVIPKSLLYNLDSFNEAIYCPVKHEVSEKEEGHMYSVADALALTFVSIRLCQQIRDCARNCP